MRPEVLYPLFADVTTLPGVGPRIKMRLEKLCGSHVIDLLWHLPTGVVDRRWRPKVCEAIPERIGTVEVEILNHRPSRNRRSPYRIICRDETGPITLVFFGFDRKYLERIYPVGETRLVSGKFERFGGKLQMAHPDYAVPLDKADEIPAIETVYPQTAGLSPKTLRKAIAAGVKRAPELDEWIDPSVISQQMWPNWKAALSEAHHPDSALDLAPNGPARSRLAYDELFASQLALSLIRAHRRRRKGRAIKADGRLRARIVEALPFQLTKSQTIAIEEILADMRSPDAMLRLIQGDVGSGKTVVALAAIAEVVEAGLQSAMLAPTEILARQHFEGLQPLLDAAGVRAGYLSGRVKAAERREILEALRSGKIQVLFGTHALFQEQVEYHDLGLIVVDEQHRFGVHQRLALAKKGARPDMLVMTATPIPRTLTLAVYGDMDVTRIREKPPGRSPITTKVISLNRVEEVVKAIGRAIERGERAYWVCPLIEESEDGDFAAAKERYSHLNSVFGDRVGLVHGRMKTAERDAAMGAFARGEIQILVATTVIEVGVDVPEATIMVVEQAERFGLSQLHQLRGRVGRGDKPSYCLLLRAPKIGEIAERRLKTLRETEDGFLIAESDLELRGPGELLGTRQSGEPDFRLADLAVHAGLLAIAHDDARAIITRDPGLSGDRGEALRTLLYLFGRDAAIGLMRSG